MWRSANRQRIREELPGLLKFLIEYFKAEIQTVVVYGSYLHWSFRKDSDVDIAIILCNSQKWRWSSSESFWDACDDSPHRQDFFRKLGQFLEKLDASHTYDVKVFTARDLELLEEFQKRVVHARGNLVPSIRKGRIIFQRKEMGMADVKKGHRSFVEFLNRELPNLGLTHWYGSYDDYGMTCDYHDIGKIVTAKRRFLFFNWTSTRHVTIANIVAEPDSPIHAGKCEALRIRVKERDTLPALQTLCEKFEDATFGLKAELVY